MKDQATVPEEEQVKEPQTEQETKQQEPIPETQPQRGEDISTTQSAQIQVNPCRAKFLIFIDT